MCGCLGEANIGWVYLYMHFMQCLQGCTRHKMKIALVTMPFALKFSHCAPHVYYSLVCWGLCGKSSAYLQQMQLYGNHFVQSSLDSHTNFDGETASNERTPWVCGMPHMQHVCSLNTQFTNSQCALSDTNLNLRFYYCIGMAAECLNRFDGQKNNFRQLADVFETAELRSDCVFYDQTRARKLNGNIRPHSTYHFAIRSCIYDKE